jgi:hypothetical protein
MSAPPPHEASTAAALVADLRAEEAELAEPPPSLFHVNNKYSHRRPRLVCARRLPILLPRPFTRRGAGAAAGIAPGIANRFKPTVTSGSGRRNPRGGSPGFRSHRVALAWAGTGTLERPEPLRTSAPNDAGTRNINSSEFKKKKKNHLYLPCSQPKLEDPKRGR